VSDDFAVINVEETIGKTVGRRRVTDAARFSDGLRRAAAERLRRTGPRSPFKGVFRFQSHEEADAWMMRMHMARTDRPT
jgi:hypothetical protein